MDVWNLGMQKQGSNPLHVTDTYNLLAKRCPLGYIDQQPYHWPDSNGPGETCCKQKI